MQCTSLIIGYNDKSFQNRIILRRGSQCLTKYLVAMTISYFMFYALINQAKNCICLSYYPLELLKSKRLSGNFMWCYLELEAPIKKTTWFLPNISSSPSFGLRSNFYTCFCCISHADVVDDKAQSWKDLRHLHTQY